MAETLLGNPVAGSFLRLAVFALFDGDLVFWQDHFDFPNLFGAFGLFTLLLGIFSLARRRKDQPSGTSFVQQSRG